MAEAKGTQGPRSNPLYGGPAPSNRAPIWARKGPFGRSSVDSSDTSDDSASHYSIPPFEHPGYTVETPFSEAAGGSPYHAPPYYVHTPAASDIGLQSPYSSAPSSPSRYPPSAGAPTPYVGGEAESQRSVRLNPLSKLRPGRAGKPLIGKIEEEEEEEFPDLERDQQRWEKQCTCTIWLVIFFLLGIAGIAALVLWSIYEPVAPKYKLLNVFVNRFDLVPSSFDAHGVSTYTVYGNITVIYRATNPNDHFKVHHEASVLQFGYSSLNDVLLGVTQPFEQSSEGSTTISANTVGVNYPLYGAGPGFQQAWDSSYIPLRFVATFNSHVNVIWKIFQSDFKKQYGCIVGLNSTTLQLVNSTCTSPTNPYAFRD